MTMPLVLVAAMVVLYACGVYLLLDRTLTRVLLGFLLVGNATNLLIFLMTGSFGVAPLVGEESAEEMSDPLPQAFILTAIVITFGVSAFLLALIYRSWRLARGLDDTVQDDEADLEIASTEALTTVEVTDEDLAEAPEFSDEEADDEHGDRDGEPDEGRADGAAENERVAASGGDDGEERR
ncbi:Na(+)/H(+) antiporter subunit C [Leucobacter massiliensis]|uniref:Na(+)/H(+) antiporter subunit C n=1 Tax=Leucobacter massiliensis TaxID=1686285 RepID=A0A2S9QQH3_9MICO|nr:Na(+)/H(+) antiporter subunit C [Leucobacter massiliensis]PRI11822.1 Na(+)/H(+) antiporter subunit C [Leucobacter massiliensis]